MANDSEDSHRKHRRSPSDDDSQEDSKRHKHRHHRHHRRHRHHHRHSSSKHDDAKNDEIEAKNKEKVVGDVGEIVTKPPPPDYDMEEGEIVEDEAEVEFAGKKVGSDVESGELKDGDGRSDVDYSNMSVDTASENPGNDILLQTDYSRKSTRHLMPSGSDQSGERKEYCSNSHHDELLVLEKIGNGDLASRSSRGESRLHMRHKSSSNESSKEKNRRRSESKQPVLELMEVEENDHGDKEKSYSQKVRDVRQEPTYRSPSHSHGRYHEETTSDRSTSESPDRMRERERSQSILHEKHLKLRYHHERDERHYGNGKFAYEVDGHGDGRGDRYYRAGDGEKPKDKGEEKYMDEKMYQVKKQVDRESSKERSERDHYRDWKKRQDRVRSRDREREKDSVRDKDRSRETKTDMVWDRDHGGSRDRDLERERRREKDRGRSRDRNPGRERRRDDSIPMYRDREWDKAQDKSRKLEMDRGRDRFSGRDRDRDTARDSENERSRRYYKYNDRYDEYDNRDRQRGYDEAEYRKDRKMKYDLEKYQAPKVDSQKEFEDGINGNDDEQVYQETVDVKPVEQEQDDIDKIKEESRRRREAILQKYKAQQAQQQQAVPQVLKDKEQIEQPSQNLVSLSAVQEENIGVNGSVKDASVVDRSFKLGKPLAGHDLNVVDGNTVALGEGSPKSERSNDMFCDDIFGDSPAGVRKMGKGDGLPLERSGLHDNWDDPEGYYSFRFGEILDSRYEITAAHGKGVFSTVVRAKDLKAGVGDPEEVAIKIIRNNETMLKAGTEELVILKKLVGADPDDRRHCVRYLSHFKYRNHLCIVFESLHMNLREVLKKFGRNIGLKLTAVRTYAKQLFIALKHLRNCGVLHCDIKPDNMLVNDSKNVLKLCDFGNAMFAGKNEITPYLVSRFYRAPEIILGLPYDHPMDMWSVGCCLYELYTGKVLFPGPSNNDMLRLHMELKGPFPKKMLRKGAFIEQHFDQDLNFLATEEDPVTKKAIRRLFVNIKPKDIANIIRGSVGEDLKMLANFRDLLDKVFVLDPDKRLTVSQALNHPFITGK